MRLKKEFFNCSTLVLAQKILGTYLAHESNDGITVGKIVETEAYLSKNDPGCHAYKGETPRNSPMFGIPGKSYIYFIYGMYFCFNITSGKVGKGEAVLIRALEPIDGLDIMMERRGTKDILKLCSGPGKLCVAMGINKSLNNILLEKGPLTLRSKYKKHVSQVAKRSEVVRTTRIGLSSGQELPYRFYLKESKFVSKV